MNSASSPRGISDPFRFRSISSAACMRASLVLRIDQHSLRERDLPLLTAEPPLGFVEQPLHFTVLARDARRRDACALPHVVVVDLGHRRPDAVLELRLRRPQVMTLLLERMRLGKVELAGEDSDPAARHSTDSSEADRPLDDRGSPAYRRNIFLARV